MADLWQYLVLLILNSLLCIGIYKACDYELDRSQSLHGHHGIHILRHGSVGAKSILWFIKFYGNKLFGETFMSPICGCVICMASIHSIYVFWSYHSFTLPNVVGFILYVFCLAGLNTINARFT
jgi:hypothetical protein